MASEAGKAAKGVLPEERVAELFHELTQAEKQHRAPIKCKRCGLEANYYITVADDNTRLRALDLGLQYGYGKPATQQEEKRELPAHLRLEEWTDAELEGLVGKGEALAPFDIQERGSYRKLRGIAKSSGVRAPVLPILSSSPAPAGLQAARPSSSPPSLPY